MKAGFGKVKLSRKTSAKSGSSKDISASQEDKIDKLGELKAKVQKQRQVMRQSGKRFHKNSQQQSKHIQIQTQSDLKKVEKTEASVFSKKQRVVQVSVGQQKMPKVQEKKSIVKDSIDLTSLITEEKEISMSSSRIFEQQMAQQKDRNKEVRDFLQKIELSQFSQGLINLGYDELDVLVQVTCEELNFLMMRASQQKMLTSALKQYKQKNGLQESKAVENSFAKTSSLFHVNVKNQVIKEKKDEKVIKEIVRPKSAITVASTANNSGLFSNNSNVKPNPSFFIGIGGQEWSMDSLVRRACSTCFKIYPGGEMIYQEGSYYCQRCKRKAQDPLQIQMKSSMIRDYKQ